MGMIKDYNSKKKPLWKRMLLTIISLVFMFFLLGYMISGVSKDMPQMKYEVKVSNHIGHETYECERYERVDNTYKLFNESDIVTNEITITEGYVIQISLNDE